MTDALEKLQILLKELFQTETAADLDFGIYRIMGHKRTEITAFVEDRLPQIVDATLKEGALSQLNSDAEQRRELTDRIRENFGEYAISPSGELNEAFHETPRGKEYLALPPEAPETGGEQLEASIFNHLYTFLSRYYDRGDFLSRRRYSKRQKYAVPYNGEEVYLHWANSDQYYIKTGENFTNYRFESGGVAVHFELVEAATEQNNVKGKARHFVPQSKAAKYDRKARLATIPFEYRPLTDKEEKQYGAKNGRQEKINAAAVPAILARLEANPEAVAALESERTRTNDKAVSHLAYHLRRYTGKNTSDFFIHKDLKGFLERELDFYLKNEVLNVDDLLRWGTAFSEGRFQTLRVMKEIGHEIIAFLAQIEDFQKALFEKKKFVVATGYCLTLDNVPEDLYPEVAANNAQYEEWQELFDIAEIPANLENGTGDQRSIEWLKANPYLILDTKHFDTDFEDRLLSSIEDLDEKTDGLLVSGDNFQALNLLQDRYREQIKCIYIDPPYNTGDDGFIYKDSYQHSSWMSMVTDRLSKARSFNKADGTIVVSIDDIEVERLADSLDLTYGPNNELATLIWDRNRKNDAKFFSIGHEYMLVYARDESFSKTKVSGSGSQKKGWKTRK